MSADTIALLALGVSIVVSLLGFGEKLFGGGNKLAAKFAQLDKDKTAEITDLRLEFIGKIEIRDNNARIGFEAVTANMHIIKEALLENRAQMAENYMRRDSYYKASEELKRDFKEKHDDLKHEVHQGFAELKDQIGAVAQSIEAGRKSSRNHA
jgi:hypothetical protein